MPSEKEIEAAARAMFELSELYEGSEPREFFWGQLRDEYMDDAKAALKAAEKVRNKDIVRVEVV